MRRTSGTRSVEYYALRVGYRDELETAHARIAALEADLAAERAARPSSTSGAEALEKAPTDVLRIDPDPLPTKRSIHYYPPGTYVPMVHLLVASLRAAWRRAPKASFREADTDSVVLWALAYLKVPLNYGLWLPIYVVSVLFAVALATIITLLVTPVLAPIIAALRFSFAPDAPVGEKGWFQGDCSDEAGAVYLCALTVIFLPASLPMIAALEEIWSLDD